MSPEEKARLVIDEQLEKSGWIIQDMKELNLAEGRGVAVREYPTSSGEVDYALFVDGISVGYAWSDMNTLKGAELEDQYKKTLEKLGEQKGILGKIFKGATNKINNAAILYRVVQMIDAEKWVSMSSDVKGEIYEGLLQKNAEDIKSGAGQYFTPRPVIRAMVRCVRPEPMKTISDPCCGGGGFFLASQSFLADPNNYTLDRE